MGRHDLVREQPLYESPPSWRSLGGRYLVFGDRIELRTMFGRYRIPFDDLESLTKVPPGLSRLRGKMPVGWYQGVKLDCGDLVEHLNLLRRTGTVRMLSFTPQDLDGFLNAVRKAGGIR